MMKQYLSCALVLIGCSGGELPPAELGAVETDAMPADVGNPRELARFDAAGHEVEIYELSPGSLMVVEDGMLDEPSTLQGVLGKGTLAELYSHFVAGAVPAALVEFDQRAPDAVRRLATAPSAEAEPVPPARASASPGIRTQSEAGASHFINEHCADEPAADAASLGTSPVAVRTFCWASGFTNSFEETASAGVLTHEISAVDGDICYTSIDDTASKTIQILEGHVRKVWRSNERIIYDVPCPSGAVCSGVSLPRVRQMSGKVSCATGDTWRFGGGFWKPNPKIYTPD